MHFASIVLYFKRLPRFSLINSFWLALSLLAALLATEFTDGASHSLLAKTIDHPGQQPLIISDKNQAIPTSSNKPTNSLTAVKSPRHGSLTKRHQDRHSFNGYDGSPLAYLQRTETNRWLYSPAMFAPAKNYYQASLQLYIAARAPPFSTNS